MLSNACCKYNLIVQIALLTLHIHTQTRGIPDNVGNREYPKLTQIRLKQNLEDHDIMLNKYTQ